MIYRCCLAELRVKELIIYLFRALSLQVDNVSLLDNTIEYLKDLHRRVKDLESCREYAESGATLKEKCQESMEGTSDNYRKNRNGHGGMPLINKRKASNIDDMEVSESSAENVTVRISNEDVVIKMSCQWREGVLFEIMDALSSHSLDSHSVQSSTSDATLHLKIKSKVKFERT